MRRSARVLATLALLGAVGCQDYNFNPVGHCYIQPGTKRETLADVSTADILFVVDDSGSMKGEQAAIGENFATFVNRLNAINVDRTNRGLDAIDFHIAVTTTAMFLNLPPVGNPWRCLPTCGATPGPICCDTTTNPDVPLQLEKDCPGGSGCGSGFTCRTDCPLRAGEQMCCNASGTFELETFACSAADAAASQPCGEIYRRYPTNPTGAGCEIGVGTAGGIYPRGNFVSAGSNPKVLHFDKELYSTGRNLQNQTQQQLIDFFAREEPPASGEYVGNAIVGTCGSGQEQGFAAARAAIEKALANQQPGVAAGEWPHPGAKLVVVFVGDEDDCSSEEDAGRGVVYSACTGDPDLDPTSEFAEFLRGLGRPLGVAFMVSAHAPGADRYAVCQDFGCDAGLCCSMACGVCGTQDCGGQQAGVRFLELRDIVGTGASASADIVAGSICDPSFGSILERVADIVQPPDVLDLPTAPATNRVAVLRVVDRNGLTRRTCVGPAAPGLTAAQAGSTGCGGAPCDWWFVASKLGSRDSVSVSQFVFINHGTGNCEANPGETYSADYLGIVPESGCTPPATDPPAGQPAPPAPDCATALGGVADDWICQRTDWTSGGPTGTCLCRTSGT